MTKEELRQDLKKERGKVPRHRRKLWDRAIFEHLSALPRYAQAQKVMIYLSIGWEVDTWALVQDLQARGKEIYVPVVQREPRALLAAPFVSREDLVPAAFGILEPALGPLPSTLGSWTLWSCPGWPFRRVVFVWAMEEVTMTAFWPPLRRSRRVWSIALLYGNCLPTLGIIQSTSWSPKTAF